MSSLLNRPSPEVTRILQQELQDRGQNLGRSGIDGNFGRHTAHALHHLPRQEREKLMKMAQEKANSAKLADQPQPSVQATTTVAESEQAANPLMSPNVNSTISPEVPNAGPARSLAGLKAYQSGMEEPKGPASMATGKTAVFDPVSGKIFLPNGQSFEAGSGLGFNEHAANKGVIPQGKWKVGMPEQRSFKLHNGTHTISTALSLMPGNGVQTHGRDGFLIHPSHTGKNISFGCVVADSKAVDKMLMARRKGVFNELQVLPAPDLKADVDLKSDKHHNQVAANRFSGMRNKQANAHLASNSSKKAQEKTKLASNTGLAKKQSMSLSMSMAPTPPIG